MPFLVQSISPDSWSLYVGLPARRVAWDVVPHSAIVGWASNAMKLIFLPSDLDPSLGQDIFHGGVIELGHLLVELAIREESLMKDIDGGLLVTKGYGDLLSVEASNVVSEWLATMLLDVIEIS